MTARQGDTQSQARGAQRTPDHDVLCPCAAAVLTRDLVAFTCPFLPLSRHARLLERLRWDNRAIASLPLDPVTDNYVRTVPRACFSLVSPTPLKGPALVAHSQVGQSGWLSVTRKGVQCEGCPVATGSVRLA